MNACTYGLVHISYGGPSRYIKDSTGKEWRFEDPPYFGPIVETKTGAVRENQPGERSPFWPAVEAWYAQGKQVDERGFCIWTPPPEPILEHMGGKHYKVVGYK